jgi:hypothetical protein
MATKKKGGGGKLSRSMTVTVRLDPKLRFAAELAARKQRRTVSSFIEWAIEDSLNRFLLFEGDSITNEPAVTTMDATTYIWDVDEMERFVNLAFSYPELQTHDEQILWKLICLHGDFWKGRYDDSNYWIWDSNKRQSLLLNRLREHWETFKKVASGELEKDALPTWSEKKQTPVAPDFDDDIPF